MHVVTSHELGMTDEGRSGGGACLTGCVPSTGWSTWDPSAITTTTDEPPIIRLRPSHQRCLLLCKRTAPKTALPHRNDTM